MDFPSFLGRPWRTPTSAAAGLLTVKLLQPNGCPVVKHVGLWRTPTSTVAGLLVVTLLQPSGRPVVKHMGLRELRNSCVCCLHNDVEACYGWGLDSVTLLYSRTSYILKASLQHRSTTDLTAAAATAVTPSRSLSRRRAEPSLCCVALLLMCCCFAV